MSISVCFCRLVFLIDSLFLSGFFFFFFFDGQNVIKIVNLVDLSVSRSTEVGSMDLERT